jgi:hypothetical protein
LPGVQLRVGGRLRQLVADGAGVDAVYHRFRPNKIQTRPWYNISYKLPTHVHILLMDTIFKPKILQTQ